MKFPAKKNATFTRFHGAKQTGPANPPFYRLHVISREREANGQRERDGVRQDRQEERLDTERDNNRTNKWLIRRRGMDGRIYDSMHDGKINNQP